MPEKNSIRAAQAAMIGTYLTHLPEPKHMATAIRIVIVYEDGREQHEIGGDG